MKLKELLAAAGLPSCTERMGECEITGVVSHSRAVKKGNLFVALRGLHCDGAQYVADAFLRGAAFVLSERTLEGERTMTVENARMALARLCDAWYGHPTSSLSLIGITGTNGKTSTATMLAHILESAGHKTGLIGTVECRCGEQRMEAANPEKLANMTTPDPAELYAMLAQMRDRGAEYVVMEVTSHALALDKVEPLRFKRAVFTNLSEDHLDFHADMDAYFAQKCKLFSKCEMAVISYTTSYGIRLGESIECPFLELSPQTVRDIAYYGTDGVSFVVRPQRGVCIPIHLPVPGQFSVENGALAALTAYSLGMDAQGIMRGLASFAGVRGRMEQICRAEGDITVFLDYAHTPDALEKLLLTARGFAAPHQRVTVLFGCGGERDRGKRREMGRIASRLADLVILTSDNARGEDPDAILEQILRGIDKEKPYLVIKDRRLAISYAVENARSGDILLLAGKGHEEYEIKGNARMPFSEREIVKECLALRARKKEDAN